MFCFCFFRVFASNFHASSAAFVGGNATIFLGQGFGKKLGKCEFFGTPLLLLTI